MNVLTGENYEINFNGENRGSFTLDGKTIYLVYSINANRDFVKLTWGQRASYGYSGDLIDTFLCENSCEDSDLSDEYSDGKNIKEKGNVKWKDENGASGVSYDECYRDDLNKIYENYCENMKFKRELVNCPDGAACYDGACKSEGVCGNGIVEENEICDPPGSESDCVTNNGYPGKRPCYNLCIIYADCQTAYRCGDLICNGPENITNCAGDCGVGVCGNGVKEGSEGCDDGNLNNGDGCSAGCQMEKECIDSDNGQNVDEFGNVTIKSIPDGDILNFYSDFCSISISGEVWEYYCSGDISKRLSLPCPEGYSCNNGVCAQVSPSPEFDNFSIVEEIWKRLFGP